MKLEELLMTQEGRGGYRLPLELSRQDIADEQWHTIPHATTIYKKIDPNIKAASIHHFGLNGNRTPMQGTAKKLYFGKFQGVLYVYFSNEAAVYQKKGRKSKKVEDSTFDLVEDAVEAVKIVLENL